MSLTWSGLKDAAVVWDAYKKLVAIRADVTAKRMEKDSSPVLCSSTYRNRKRVRKGLRVKSEGRARSVMKKA
jgi:hypothetical protein